MAVQLIGSESGVFKMEVVEHRVLNARFDEIAGERLFPNAFGHPHAANVGAQAIVQPLAVATDLSDSIARGNHRENRFVERAADDFDSALSN